MEVFGAVVSSEVDSWEGVSWEGVCWEGVWGDVVNGDGVVCGAKRVVVVVVVLVGVVVVVVVLVGVVVVVVVWVGVVVVVVGRETTSQVFADVAPTVVVDLPASQSVHVAAPKTVLYFPAPHAMHVPPLGPVYPSLHKQRATSGELAHSVLPFRQSMQGADPAVDLYLPIAHDRQFGALPVLPAPHIHDD